MTIVVPTLGANGQIPAMWNALLQQINSAAKIATGAQVNTSRGTLDQYGNQTMVIGNLSQVVTIGATGDYQGGVFVGQPGVLVATNLQGFGLATPSDFAQTTITTTKGSTAATVASATGFVNGNVIGAIDPSGSSVITPGTTYTFSGTAVTLSAAALESGSSFYCCSCLWVQTGSSVHP